MRTPTRAAWIVAGAVAGLLLLTLFLWWPGSRSGEASVALQPTPLEPEAAEEAERRGPSPVDFGAGEVLSLAWRFAILAVAMGSAIVALRWWARRAASPRSTTGLMRVVDTLGVGNGRTVHLLALGTRVLVIGATPQALTFLAELDEETARRLLEEDRSSLRFRFELLRSLTRSNGGSPIAEVRP